MAEVKKNILTRAGLDKYEKELNELTNVKRLEVAEKIKIAREQGDLSENAEYDAAKEEQREIEARIQELEKLLKNAEIVSEDEVTLDKVSVGCSVSLHDDVFDEDVTFHIVGSSEANSLLDKISNESPVGAGLIGHEVGETVVIETMAGEMKYTILGIQRAQ
ncbi:Transcription elongation factor GreA [Lachnospiraceae bacterium TWA4]|nr:Transcription elongation factor GreA [Lachnospiraceae bacterium TWA4]